MVIKLVCQPREVIKLVCQPRAVIKLVCQPRAVKGLGDPLPMVARGDVQGHGKLLLVN